MSRLDDLLDPLVDAVCAPQGWHGQEQLRALLAKALRGTVKHHGGQEVDGSRLTIESCRATALDYIERFEGQDNSRAELLNWIAGLLREIREADQREHWIREGYGHGARMAWARAEEAEREAAALRHSLRLVKRATRDVKVGRES